MQAGGLARFSQYRLTGLAVAIALAAGILIGGQVDMTGALPGNSSARHEPAAPVAQAVTPHFIVGDTDGLYHQQQATMAVASGCGANNSSLFVGGDVDGLATPAVNALIPVARCANAGR